MLKHDPLQNLEVKPELLAESEVLELLKVRAIQVEPFDLLTRYFIESVFGLDKILPGPCHEDGDMTPWSLGSEVCCHHIWHLVVEVLLDLLNLFAELSWKQATETSMTQVR